MQVSATPLAAREAGQRKLQGLTGCRFPGFNVGGLCGVSHGPAFGLNAVHLYLFK
jgi:hypothetical protein